MESVIHGVFVDVLHHSATLQITFVALGALCFGLACVDAYLIHHTQLLLAATPASPAPTPATTPAPTLATTPAPTPKKKPVKVKCYSKALDLLESEQGAWYVNTILMREVTKMHKNYEAFDRGELRYE